MRQEVVDFYSSHGVPVDRIVSVGRRRGFEEKSVLKAADSLYDEIQGGKRVEPIRLAWEIFKKSGPAKDRTWPAEKSIISEIRELKELIIGQKPDRDRVVTAVKDSVGQLNRVIDYKFNSIPVVDNRQDITELRSAVDRLNRDLIELSTPWYRRVLRWLYGN